MKMEYLPKVSWKPWNSLKISKTFFLMEKNLSEGKLKLKWNFSTKCVECFRNDKHIPPTCKQSVIKRRREEQFERNLAPLCDVSWKRPETFWNVLKKLLKFHSLQDTPTTFIINELLCSVYKRFISSLPSPHEIKFGKFSFKF